MLSEPGPEHAPSSDEPSKEAPQPFQFSLTTLLAIMTAASLCLTVAVWSADPIVLPALLGAVLLRAIFTQGPRRRMQVAISAGVGAIVTLVACFIGWNIESVNELAPVPREPWIIEAVSQTSFLEFIFFVAPLNAVRCYATSGALAFFLCYQMLKQPARSSEHMAQRLSTVVVIVAASIVVATIMGCEHFPFKDHH